MPFKSFKEEDSSEDEHPQDHPTKSRKTTYDKLSDHHPAKYIQIQGMEKEADRWLEDRMLSVALLLNVLSVDWDDFIEYYELQWMLPRNKPTHTFASDSNLDEDFL